MWIAVLFFSILQFTFSSCPDNFELVRDGQCRGPYVDEFTMSFGFDDAYNVLVSKCAEMNGQPIIIHNEEENSYWRNWKDPDGRMPAYLWPIGLTCNTTSKLWQWADGSALDFKPASYDPALDLQCETGCAWTMSSENKWLILRGKQAWTPYVFCTTQLQQPFHNGCEKFQLDTDDGTCYQVGESAESWQDAQISCRKMGANLASIHNSQENSFLRRLAVSKGAVDGIFLGGTLTGKGHEYGGWTDGSNWDYENYRPGYPKDGAGDCLSMDTSTSSGQWINRDCSNKLPIACIRNERSIADPWCRNQSWNESEVITSPGFPFNASVPCEFIFSVDEGKRVELELILLEANKCCDSLQIYDDQVGGQIIANLTGEIRDAAYIGRNQFMRVVWRPNGGVNVRGAAMVFRGV